MSTLLVNTAATSEIKVESATDNSNANVESSAAALRMKAGQWHADLELTVTKNAAGARLNRYRRNGPLHVQKAFYPEGPDLAHLYLLHPPGGLVSGDSLTISVNIEAASRSLVTTPGAGRLYGVRKNANQQVQNNFLSVAQAASLEWFPMETLFYSGCNGNSHTRIDIADGGHFIGWDIACLGLPASDQPFVCGQLRQSLEIHYDGKIEWLERWRFSADDCNFLNSTAGLAGQSTNGIFLAGPFNMTLPNHVLDTLHQQCTLLQQRNLGFAGVTRVGKWLAIRYVGPSATHAREHFIKAWHTLRPLLINRNACPPRIWAC